MRKNQLARCLAILTCLVSGCDRRLGGILPPSRVEEIRITIRRLPGTTDLKTPCTLTITDRLEINGLIGQLRRIDWSQPGMDLTVATLPEPDGVISILGSEGIPIEISFYWDGGLIDRKANRLIRSGDFSELRRIVRRACN